MQRVGTRFLGALKYGGHSGAEEGGEVGRVSASSPSALFLLGGLGGGRAAGVGEISPHFAEEKSLNGYARRWLL